MIRRHLFCNNQSSQQPLTRHLCLGIILFLQLSDPLSSQTLAPFIPQVSKVPLLERESDHNWNFVKLIRDIGVTHGDESQVGHYVGILVGMFSPFLLLCPSLIFPQAIIILCSSCINYFSSC
ncbi:hypothetical protein CY34DRAFT_646822 [Suillus luteus UH-Slu-Lm8-n1]|uniref:Uncharacterized protein n=1 Tax=Suillus luteus UH-Slu-Lm8-n1 TaxID=930992 RepID=A0A0C9ZY12_9AGAM|nr:hypothetical protein CY34DRAFT_646822 [Suillus luteus UH-Slu-Lm8-n1]